jgi:hypothetical protein
MHSRLIRMILVGGLALAAIPPDAHAGTPPPVGALQDNQRFYFPQGCTHSGTRTVCTFTFVNSGDATSLNAGPGARSELMQLQMIDDAHVPHGADMAYFVDKFGNRQSQLYLGNKDQGVFVAEFPNVDPQVTSAQFQRQAQIVGPVAVAPGQPSFAPAPQAPPLPQPMQAPAQQIAASPQQLAALMQQQTAMQQPGQPQLRYLQEQQQLQQLGRQSEAQNLLLLSCAQQQSANGALCKAAGQVNSAQQKVAAVNGTVSAAQSTMNQARESMQQLSGMFSGFKNMLPKKDPASDPAASSP